MNSPVCLHAIVRGIVQGVNFRYYTRERARQLGLAGWVKNLPDGSVEVQAEGPRPALEQFLTFLENGPRSAVVEAVQVAWTAASGRFQQFDIHS